MGGGPGWTHGPYHLAACEITEHRPQARASSWRSVRPGSGDRHVQGTRSPPGWGHACRPSSCSRRVPPRSSWVVQIWSRGWRRPWWVRSRTHPATWARRVRGESSGVRSVSRTASNDGECRGRRRREKPVPPRRLDEDPREGGRSPGDGEPLAFLDRSPRRRQTCSAASRGRTDDRAHGPRVHSVREERRPQRGRGCSSVFVRWRASGPPTLNRMFRDWLTK